MLDLSAVAASGVLHWQDLGLQPGIDLGFFTLRYYSLAYLFGLFAAYGHIRKMIAAPGAPLALRHADDLLFYCMMGVIFGGRLGYALFYKPELFTGFSGDGFVTWELLRLWDGGMSFHGGLIGVLAAIAYVSWRGDLSFIRVCDYIAVNVGFGMLFGRLANFVNGELWGRPVQSDVAWAMVFPGPGPEPRHPSQLYEAGLEGLLVICVMLPLFWFTRARYRPGLLVGVFTAMIASARFIVEFFRQPDAHLTEFAISTGLSMGQWLTIPLILAGLGIVVWALVRPSLASPKKPAEA
jgi:phosphatidylglycerol:prolipoprotein diacylglycerol transferase